MGEKEKEREKMEREGKTASPAKLLLMPNCVFHKSKPAIVGVRILAGTLRTGVQLMRQDGRIVGRLKEIQKDKEGIKSIQAPDESSISIENVTVGRQVNEGDILYVHITAEDMAKIKAEDLTEDEKSVLREMRELKRARQREENPDD